MIQLPRRSVTRFFIPLIDVLTLLFCIFLLMPVVRARVEESEGGADGAGISEQERRELQRLRRERDQWRDLAHLEEAKTILTEELHGLQARRRQALEKSLAIRVLEIGDDGRLFAYDAQRPGQRRFEIDGENVADYLQTQKREAGAAEPYFLILYPKPTTGWSAYPLRRQREEFDRWFRDVAHSYDIPFANRS